MILSDIKSAPATAPIDAVLLSRNETEALCLKAARGAGMSWGLAEEAAFAAGWLGAHGIDGAGALLRHLDAVGAAKFDQLRPWPQPGYWRAASDGVLCPICLGSALLDHAGLADGPFAAPVQTDAASQPVLLAPFLAEAGARLGGAISLSCAGLALSLGAGQPDTQALAALAGIATAPVRLAPSAFAPCPSMPMQPAAVSTATIATLEAYALRITVPATEASRRGAGAGSNDND
ncbi:DUF3726 domain-containing protein [Paracoccus sp. MKU1]|uniref:DUF3726 domain-containing protein n=1 Tax=Paracoccus sp. MKU1 TaxID=1745182 RepID=UPI0007193198|nr:DUF3726 domain-containing protein [Paracoccus sp. MKU1]KRW96234.1 hypothetical protein AQY21_10140 [Paracoccus sp. MKU1]